MERVKGVGGIFFRARDKERLLAWYRDNLGIATEDWGGAVFAWKDFNDGMTVWSPFEHDTTYFSPGTASFMINFIVSDLDAMLAQLRSAGAEVEDKVEESEYGRFGWVIDPEGNKIELWQPPKTKKAD